MRFSANSKFAYQIAPLHLIYFIQELDEKTGRSAIFIRRLLALIHKGLARGEIARVLIVAWRASSSLVAECNQLGIAVDVMQHRNTITRLDYLRSLKWLLLAEPCWVLHATCELTYTLASYLAFRCDTPRVISHCISSSQPIRLSKWLMRHLNHLVYPGVANHVVFTSPAERVHAVLKGVARERTHLHTVDSMEWHDFYKLYHQTFDHTLFPKETMTRCREISMIMVNQRVADTS